MDFISACYIQTFDGKSNQDELIHWDQISLRRAEDLAMDPAALVETWCQMQTEVFDQLVVNG